MGKGRKLTRTEQKVASKNISKQVRAGVPQKQAVAIELNVQRQKRKKGSSHK